MKALIHVLFVLSLGFFFATPKTADIYIKQGSEISITGSSNVNCFTCHYTTEIASGCQQIEYKQNSNTIYLKNAEINLKSKAFDCGGRMINKDFNTLMESDKFPHIKIIFEEIIVMENGFEIFAQIEIAQKFNQCSFIISTQNNYNYTGKLELNIKDFDMEAPRKLLGAIKVDPEIIINFDFNLDID
jgi:hypothetical protein